MIRTIPAISLSALALALLTTAAAAQSIPDLLLRASERYGEIDGMCATFDQNLEVPLLRTEVPSNGRLCSLRPAYFRMDFVEPDGDAIVADGEFLWVYYPSSQPGQVLRSPLGEGTEVDFTREFLSDPETKYAATDEGADDVDGRPTRRIALNPHSDDLGYTRATVWIDPAQLLIRRVEIHQENGSVRRLTLSEIDLRPGLGVSDFTFAPEPGVQVVSIGGDVRDR